MSSYKNSKAWRIGHGLFRFFRRVNPHRHNDTTFLSSFSRPRTSSSLPLTKFKIGLLIFLLSVAMDIDSPVSPAIQSQASTASPASKRSADPDQGENPAKKNKVVKISPVRWVIANRPPRIIFSKCCFDPAIILTGGGDGGGREATSL